MKKITVYATYDMFISGQPVAKNEGVEIDEDEARALISQNLVTTTKPPQAQQPPAEKRAR